MMFARLLLLITLASPVCSFADDVIPPVTNNEAENMLGDLTAEQTNLTTTYAPGFIKFARIELSVIVAFQILFIVGRWTLNSMNIGVHFAPVKIGDIYLLWIETGFVSLLIYYWVNPLPVLGFGLNHFMGYVGKILAVMFDQTLSDELNAMVTNAANGTPWPKVFNPIQVAMFFIIQFFMGFVKLVILFVDSGAIVIYGVAAIFAPIIFPWYIPKSQRHRFWRIVDVLIAFSMMRVVAAAFTFLWSNMIIHFLQKTFNGNYALDIWIGHLTSVVALFGTFTLMMLAIPIITMLLFGGGASAASVGGGFVRKFARG